MNHIYRIVWNHATACYQAVTETAKGQGKTTKSSNASEALGNPPISNLCSMPLTATALGAVLCMLSLPGFAGPAGGQVTAGSATISQTGNTTTINQTSNKAAIDWTQFSVGRNESVRFNQPSASSLTLNRVTGTESSAIMGSLSANGQVFILNPNGVLFGAGSQVNVGGLVASTLKLDNTRFMAGNYKFTGDGAGSVVNNGTITVAPGGTLALMAPVVQNTGTLSAPGGSVLLAGAQAVTLTLQTDGGLVAYTLDSGSVQALVDNGGLIQANGGHVVLTAKGVDALSQAVVNHSGVIEAQTVTNKSGVIELLGDMQSGAVHLSGKLDASAPNGGDGGFIDTSAAQVKIADTAKVTTAAAAGQTGTWLIDPTDFTITAGNGSSTTSSIGAATLAASLGSTDVNIATSETGTGNGDIFVNSAVDWSANKLTLTAHRNININADLNGSGTAKLALEYGQATSSGTDSDYILNGAKVNLPAGQNFSTKQGSTGVVKNYTVITSLGVAGSTTGTDLQGINGNLAENYVLGGDINASATSGWNSGAGFMQIGYQNTPFSGVLDGFGHTVSNLYVNRPNDIEVGLIGTLTQGTVRNISAIDVSITGHSIVGGLIGAMRWGSTLKNAYSTGTVKGTGQALSSGQIDGATGIGGLVGAATPYISYPSDGYSFCISCISIDGSASSATVYGNSGVGGLIGFTDQILIRNSYAAGSVNGLTIGNQSSSYIGGLVGNYFNSTELSHSYSSAQVQSTGSNYVGGLVGNSNGRSIAPSTFFDLQKSGVLTSAGGTGKTTAEMQQQATYAGWDFVNTWHMVEGKSYPILNVITLPSTLTPASPTGALPPSIANLLCNRFLGCFDEKIKNNPNNPIKNLTYIDFENPYQVPESMTGKGSLIGEKDFKQLEGKTKSSETEADAIKVFFTDPMIDEGFANAASLTIGEIIEKLKQTGIFSTREISDFLLDKKVSGKFRSKIIAEVTKGIDLKDMATSAAVTLVSNLFKETLKETLDINRTTPANAMKDWAIEQAFLLGQVMVTGGTPVAIAVAEAQLTTKYISDVLEKSSEINSQNLIAISDASNIINSAVNLTLTLKKAYDQGRLTNENKTKMEALIVNNINFLVEDALPQIRFNSAGIVVGNVFGSQVGFSGKVFSPFVKKLYMAELNLRTGNEQEAMRLIKEVQNDAYKAGDGDGGGVVVQGVRQLIRELGLLSIESQIGQGNF
jgi:filamentous hemagglutinin family protein